MTTEEIKFKQVVFIAQQTYWIKMQKGDKSLNHNSQQYNRQYKSQRPSHKKGFQNINILVQYPSFDHHL